MKKCGCSEKKNRNHRLNDGIGIEEAETGRKKKSMVEVFSTDFCRGHLFQLLQQFPLCHLGIPALPSLMHHENASTDQPVPDAQPQAETTSKRTVVTFVMPITASGGKYSPQRSCIQVFFFSQSGFGIPSKENHQDCDFKQVKQLRLNLL